MAPQGYRVPKLVTQIFSLTLASGDIRSEHLAPPLRGLCLESWLAWSAEGRGTPPPAYNHPFSEMLI